MTSLGSYLTPMKPLLKTRLRKVTKKRSQSGLSCCSDTEPPSPLEDDVFQWSVLDCPQQGHEGVRDSFTSVNLVKNSGKCSVVSDREKVGNDKLVRLEA